MAVVLGFPAPCYFLRHLGTDLLVSGHSPSPGVPAASCVWGAVRSTAASWHFSSTSAVPSRAEAKGRAEARRGTIGRSPRRRRVGAGNGPTLLHTSSPSFEADRAQKACWVIRYGRYVMESPALLLRSSLILGLMFLGLEHRGYYL